MRSNDFQRSAQYLHHELPVRLAHRYNHTSMYIVQFCIWFDRIAGFTLRSSELLVSGRSPSSLDATPLFLLWCIIIITVILIITIIVIITIVVVFIIIIITKPFHQFSWLISFSSSTNSTSELFTFSMTFLSFWTLTMSPSTPPY